MKNNYNLVT